MMIDAEFRAKLLRIKDKRKHSIRNSYGINDAWEWAKENKNIDKLVNKATYKRIIRAVNQKLADNLIAGKDVIFPYNMGMLEIRKYNKKIEVVNGKVKTNLAVDWKATIKFWQEDEEAKRNKTLVRFNTDTIFNIVYNKYDADYNNQLFFKFNVLRRLKLLLKEKIINNEFDTFIIDGYELR